MSKKPEKPEKKPEPELSGRGQVGFHLIKVQVSRAMPKRNPKIRVGSGFGILQVFAHSKYIGSILAQTVWFKYSYGNSDMILNAIKLVQ